MNVAIYFVSSAVDLSLHFSRAWVQRKCAARQAAAHCDPISVPPRGPLLSMLTSAY